MDKYEVDCLIIGGGVAGLAAAKFLSEEFDKTYLIERNNFLGMETSSRNSEVIHSGIYYKPDSLKAKLCKEGNELLYQYCNDKCISHSPIGKMIIGDKKSEEYLEHLIHNGKENMCLPKGCKK